MRLVSFSAAGGARAGAVLADGRVLDLAEAAADAPGAAGEALRTADLQAVIEAGPAAWELVRELVSAGATGAPPSAVRSPDGLAMLAPLPVPAKNIFCVGRNYAEHIAEGDRAQNRQVGVSEHPVFFTKPRTAVIGPGAAIPLFAHVSTSIDYEVELALVIGRRGRDIAPEDALGHVFGYTILNDISARDVQRRHGGQYFKGKGLDGSCPMGPCLVTADEIGDPHSLAIGLSVNGEMRQSSTTAAMIFDIPTLIASLSAGMTLEPGDILATGTPSGVGYAMTPPHFLRDGDSVVCEIENIGRLENICRIE